MITTLERQRHPDAAPNSAERPGSKVGSLQNGMLTHLRSVRRWAPGVCLRVHRHSRADVNVATTNDLRWKCEGLPTRRRSLGRWGSLRRSRATGSDAFRLERRWPGGLAPKPSALSPSSLRCDVGEDLDAELEQVLRAVLLTRNLVDVLNEHVFTEARALFGDRATWFQDCEFTESRGGPTWRQGRLPDDS